MVSASIATGVAKLTCCQPRGGLAGEGRLGQLGAARRPEVADVRAGVAGSLVEAQPGDVAALVGAELDAELDRAGVVVAAGP